MIRDRHRRRGFHQDSHRDAAVPLIEHLADFADAPNHRQEHFVGTAVVRHLQFASGRGAKLVETTYHMLAGRGANAAQVFNRVLTDAGVGISLAMRLAFHFPVHHEAVDAGVVGAGDELWIDREQVKFKRVSHARYPTVRLCQERGKPR